MESEAIRTYVKATFTACLISLVAARMEMKPITKSPDEPRTQAAEIPDFPSIIDRQPRCQEGWSLYTNTETSSCFRKPQMYYTLKHTAAQEFCRKEGGALATVTDNELHHILSTHAMQGISTSNSTSSWWVGYILVHSSDSGGNTWESGGNNNNTTSAASTWEIQTEEPTGPELLMEKSARIPTDVPESLRTHEVVCVQLMTVYTNGFLSSWTWNLANCDESVPFICKKGASRPCTDRKGNLVRDGDTFIPKGHDSCTVCTCIQGVPNICSVAGCAPPSCQYYKKTPDECCQYTCLDLVPDHPDNDQPKALMSENLRWVLTMITSFLLLGMMLFMVYRMRQKRIAYLRYRVQQLREGQDGDFEPGSGPPPIPALDDIDGALFREPPPPYSFFKDSGRIEMPPPYNVQQDASQRISRREVNHNRDSRGSDQPDNVRLLPGSEPTTPSDISTISTTSPPPYDRCQSTQSTPLTPETTPMMALIAHPHTATSQAASSNTPQPPLPQQAIRNTTV